MDGVAHGEALPEHWFEVAASFAQLVSLSLVRVSVALARSVLPLHRVAGLPCLSRQTVLFETGGGVG